MTQYFFKGHPINSKNGWVMIDGTRMKLNQAKKLKDFTLSTPASIKAPARQSTEELYDTFVENVRTEVSKRISSVASMATQLNIAAAAAGGILSEEQMGEYLAGLSWISQMRETGKKLILNADSDFRNDEKWPVLPDSVKHLLGSF